MDIEKSAFRAAAPVETVQGQLGALAGIVGSWKGSGFNVMCVPDGQNHKKFRVMTNPLTESFQVDPIGAPVPNRGSGDQGDIFFLGVRYLQDITNAIDHSAIHLEPGLWLNLPATDVPEAGPSIVRMGTVPHGDSLLCQGTAFNLSCGPQIDDVDATPFTLDQKTGARINETDENYLKPFAHAVLPPGVPQEALLNPNVLLRNSIAEQNIVSTTVLIVNARPIGGINGTPIAPPNAPNTEGGIVNIPFVVKNADANSMSAIFWIETVENADGSQFQQLQYTQTVILDFIGVKWPHISVATLVKH